MRSPRRSNHLFHIQPTGNFWGLAIISIFLFFSRFLFDETFFLNALYVILIYLVLSFIYSLFVLDFISIERKFRKRQWQVGDRFEEDLTIINRSVIPVLWIDLKDDSEIRTNSIHYVTGLIKGKGRHYISSSFYLQKRGKLPLGPIELKSSDPMACFEANRVILMSGSITVTPYGINLATGKSRKKDSEAARAARFTLQQSDMTSSSVRPYMEGDPLSRIHWATTARRGFIHSRHQDISIEQTTWILLDCQRQAHFCNTFPFTENGYHNTENVEYFLPCDTFETSVSIAFSLAISWIQKGISVGIALNQENEFIIQPGRGSRQMDEIVEILTFVKAGSVFPISQLLRNMSRRIIPGHICYLITPENNRDLAIACHEAESRKIDLRVVSINRMSYENRSRIKLNDIPRLSNNTFEFSYGDGLSKLSEIL